MHTSDLTRPRNNIPLCVAFYCFLVLSLYLPAVYSSRVSKNLSIIFDSNYTCSNNATNSLDAAEQGEPGTLSNELRRDFQESWEKFIDTLLSDWSMSISVSGPIAASAIAVVQIPDVASDLVTRTLAILSFVCAIMSLCCGCLSTQGYERRKDIQYAPLWIQAVQRNEISMYVAQAAAAAIWVSWSMIFVISAMLSFVWRCNSEPRDRQPHSTEGLLASRIIITLVVILGVSCVTAVLLVLKHWVQAPNKHINYLLQKTHMAPA
ncbi:hypothetical protein BJ165DRAFT_1492115 [Panaeolus papilionaceus]|nr:hypothetical protein BJ165DRAFT_1492115 [Panaeolus papilionaceus]